MKNENMVGSFDSLFTQTCIQKESVLRPENHQVINLTTEFVWSGCVMQETNSNDDADWIAAYGDDEKYDCKGAGAFGPSGTAGGTS